MTCVDCGSSFQECVASLSSTECPHCSLSECCCWPVIHGNRKHISSSSERETRLLRLRRKLGHGLDDDFTRAGDRLRNILIRDFEREKLWASADKLRSNMDASEYKHVVLGLIFLKYISDAFGEVYEELKKIQPRTPKM